MRCWCGYLSGARCSFAYGPADQCCCITKPNHLVSLKSRPVLPFCYRFIQVVLEKRPLNECSTRFLGHTRVCPLNGILIDSAIFAQPIRVTNTQTMLRCHICNNRQRLRIATRRNKSVFSFLRMLTTWHYPHSPATLLCAAQKSIDISCRPDPQQQTCSSGFAAVGPCWDRQSDRQTYGQTDERTPDRRINHHAGSAN